jgi:hypothetical protein
VMVCQLWWSQLGQLSVLALPTACGGSAVSDLGGGRLVCSREGFRLAAGWPGPEGLCLHLLESSDKQ